eukprot:GEZU01023721.1.p1 GENE.GEZU01023721.1~~GEZU01023721.1.p1  ORF type:complete len:639 (-),score=137.16 GEZU01023721.1:635-2551(-)
MVLLIESTMLAGWWRGMRSGQHEMLSSLSTLLLLFFIIFIVFLSIVAIDSNHGRPKFAFSSAAQQQQQQVDYYEILGVNRDATQADIRKSYKDLALKWHPDRNANDPQANERFATIVAAYETLNDPRKRAQYDQSFFSFSRSYGAGDASQQQQQQRPRRRWFHFSFGNNNNKRYSYHYEDYTNKKDDPLYYTSSMKQITDEELEQVLTGTHIRSHKIWFFFVFSQSCSKCRHDIAIVNDFKQQFGTEIVFRRKELSFSSHLYYYYRLVFFGYNNTETFPSTVLFQLPVIFVVSNGQLFNYNKAHEAYTTEDLKAWVQSIIRHQQQQQHAASGGRSSSSSSSFSSTTSCVVRVLHSNDGDSTTTTTTTEFFKHQQGERKVMAIIYTRNEQPSLTEELVAWNYREFASFAHYHVTRPTSRWVGQTPSGTRITRLPALLIVDNTVPAGSKQPTETVIYDVDKKRLVASLKKHGTGLFPTITSHSALVDLCDTASSGTCVLFSTSISSGGGGKIDNDDPASRNLLQAIEREIPAFVRGHNATIARVLTHDRMCAFFNVSPPTLRRSSSSALASAKFLFVVLRGVPHDRRLFDAYSIVGGADRAVVNVEMNNLKKWLKTTIEKVSLHPPPVTRHPFRTAALCG